MISKNIRNGLLCHNIPSPSIQPDNLQSATMSHASSDSYAEMAQLQYAARFMNYLNIFNHSHLHIMLGREMRWHGS